MELFSGRPASIKGRCSPRVRCGPMHRPRQTLASQGRPRHGARNRAPSRQAGSECSRLSGPHGHDEDTSRSFKGDAACAGRPGRTWPLHLFRQGRGADDVRSRAYTAQPCIATQDVRIQVPDPTDPGIFDVKCTLIQFTHLFV